MKRQIRSADGTAADASGDPYASGGIDGKRAVASVRAMAGRRLKTFAQSRLGVAILSCLLTIFVTRTLPSYVWIQVTYNDDYAAEGDSPAVGAAARTAPGLAGIPPVDPKRSVVFVGGCPRSGTTLMRVLLDSHPQVNN